MARMYHIETVKPKVPMAELEDFLRDEAMPYWRKQGFEVKFYVTFHALGYGPVWFFTGMDGMGEMDGWDKRAMGDEEGKRIMQKFQSMVDVIQASVVRDIEA